MTIRAFHQRPRAIVEPAAEPGPGLDAGPVPRRRAAARRVQAGRDERALRRLLIVGDLAALLVAWGYQAGAHWPQGAGHSLVPAAAASAATAVVLHAAGHRPFAPLRHRLEAAWALVASAIGAAVFAGVEHAAGSVTVHVAVGGGLAAAALVLVLRWRFRRWLRAQRTAGRFLRPAVLVGSGDDAVALWTTLATEPELGYRVVAVAGGTASGDPWERRVPCGGTREVGTLARLAGASDVIVVPSNLRGAVTTDVVRCALAAGLHVRIWPSLSGVSNRLRVESVSGIPLLSTRPRRALRAQLCAKRVVDVMLSAAMGAVAAPLVAGAALVVRFHDGAPAIYRSERVGRHGRLITVYKLRTMVPDAPELMDSVAGLNERTGGPLFKAADDPRVTRVGRLLRATSVDELPQLWNVLSGTMSLVGPRPALPHEVAQFDEELLRRHEMRPGITGLWQIEARDNPSFEAYRRLDLAYLDDWSLALDAAILVNTLHAAVASAVRALRSQLGRREPTTAARGNGGAPVPVPVPVPDGGSATAAGPVGAVGHVGAIGPGGPGGAGGPGGPGGHRGRAPEGMPEHGAGAIRSGVGATRTAATPGGGGVSAGTGLRATAFGGARPVRDQRRRDPRPARGDGAIAARHRGEVVAVGIDVADADDVRSSIEAFGDRFLRRVFTAHELAECGRAADPVSGLAARFAAKEAAFKALMAEHILPPWTSIEIWRHPTGWCRIRLSGPAARIARERGIGRLLMSQSHEQNLAAAIVLAIRSE